MDTKKAVIALVVVLAGGVAALAAFDMLPNPFASDGLGTQVPDVEAYESLEHHLAFVYPTTFELREIPLTNDDTSWTAITLADKETLRQAEEHGASEGPPLIAIQIFDNPTNQTAEEWVYNSRFSNFMLSANPILASTTVSGVDSVAYIYSGLFATDVVVTAHNGKLYMFLVDWLTEEDANRKVFDSLLASVQFI